MERGGEGSGAKRRDWTLGDFVAPELVLWPAQCSTIVSLMLPTYRCRLCLLAILKQHLVAPPSPLQLQQQEEQQQQQNDGLGNKT